MTYTNRPQYVVISPVRDEEEYIEHTIRSLLSQTIRPLEWVIVNDGSADRTGEIVDHYSSQYDWIRVVHRGNRGFRKAGGGVMEAFYDGYHALNSRGWGYLVKLDGDLSLGRDYFDRCFAHFDRNPKLGIGGGTILNLINGELHPEINPTFHVRGATKIYRRECWDALGGLIMAPGWDTVDEVKANMLGWETLTFPEIEVVHHRCTGMADGPWADAVKSGRANYITGYHPLFMLLKCLRRLSQKPYLVIALGHFYGFVTGYVHGMPQIDDRTLIAYVRKQQLRRLLFMPSIWR